MAKKEQKKPSKKSRTKAAVKPKKVSSGAKKAAAPDKKAPAPEKRAAPKPTKAAKFFTVAEFADMTYLTEFGVMRWLKEGKLKGQQDEKGEWQIDAANLEVPNVKRLVR